MEYQIEIIVKEVTEGEEVYRRTVALPEQVHYVADDLPGIIEAYEDKQEV